MNPYRAADVYPAALIAKPVTENLGQYKSRATQNRTS